MTNLDRFHLDPEKPGKPTLPEFHKGVEVDAQDNRSKDKGERRSHHGARPARAGLRHFLPACAATYFATASICFFDRRSLKAGILTPPFVTCLTTIGNIGLSWSRFGPTVPVVPASLRV